jgi:hypothetical protein
MAAKRNDPCPCGSGKKHKACCARKRTTSQWLAIVTVVAFALLALWVVGGVLRRAGMPKADAGPDRVWSEEHGHWHDAPGSPGTPQPPGPTPPGKVWSVEHGHWHDDAAPPARPAGPAPPGKVWSAEHGHWHDDPAAGGGARPTDPPAPQPDAPGVSYVEDPVP